MFTNGCGSYQMPTLTTKFVRCSVRTCVHHLKQMLRAKLDIPACYDLQVICCDRDLDDWITLKQVWLMCWLTKVCALHPPIKTRPAVQLSGRYDNISWNVYVYCVWVCKLRIPWQLLSPCFKHCFALEVPLHSVARASLKFITESFWKKYAALWSWDSMATICKNIS